jgi:hypothetical protein
MIHTELGVDIRSGSFFIGMFVAIWLCFGAESMQGMDQPSDSPKDSATQYRKEIHYNGDALVLVSDRQERVGTTRYRATGNVVITFLDMIVTCDEVEYDVEDLEVATKGKTEFRNKRAALTVSSAEFDPDTRSVILHDVSGYFYDTSGRSDREFFLTGGMAQNIRADKVQIHWGVREQD